MTVIWGGRIKIYYKGMERAEQSKRQQAISAGLSDGPVEGGRRVEEMLEMIPKLMS